MKLSSEDRFSRIFLLICSVIFAVPTYILWKEVIVRHQWPDNINGWLGIIMMPLLTVTCLGYGLFYRSVKKKDDEWQRDMNSNTHRGKIIKVLCYSTFLFILLLGAVYVHLVKGRPIETWEYVAFVPLILLLAGAFIFDILVTDDAIHNFLLHKGLYRIDKIIYKNLYEDENENENENEDKEK